VSVRKEKTNRLYWL